jgi:hypothetical protein
MRFGKTFGRGLALVLQIRLAEHGPLGIIDAATPAITKSIRFDSQQTTAQPFLPEPYRQDVAVM